MDKVGPCVIIFHSQAGQFGFKVAQARPNKVKALVAIEPSTGGDLSKAALLMGVPTLVVFGDFIEQDSRWPKTKRKHRQVR
jgi:pimeloyl-ACP methyl ester carboxylesterase